MTTPVLNEAHIRDAAYFIWMSEGQPEGRDAEHWARAIDILSTAAPQPKKARKSAAKPRVARKPAATRSAKAKAPAAAKKTTKT